MCSATPYQPNSFQNTVHYMTFYTLHCTLLAIDNLQGHGLLLQTAPWQFILEHFQPFLHHCLRHDHCHRQYHCQGLINLEGKIIWALALVRPASNLGSAAKHIHISLRLVNNYCQLRVDIQWCLFITMLSCALTDAHVSQRC